MSVSLDPANKIIPTKHPIVAPSLGELKPIQRDVYFPRYKCEDHARALLFEAGLIDQTGKVDRYLVHLAEIPLNDQERSRVKGCLTKAINILNADINLQVNAHDLLCDFFSPSQVNEILPLIFNNLEIVGSAVNQCLGLSFFKRFIEHLLKFALSDKDDAFIQDFLKKLFSPEFEAHLNQRLNRKLADLDLRISTNRSHHGIPAIRCIQNAFDKFMSILIGKMPVLEGEKEKNRRTHLLQLLKTHQAVDWEWLKIDDPRFYYHIFKNLAFNKLMLVSKEGEQFGILNIGHSAEVLVDFVFVLQLPRYEMFPSVRIPCLSLLKPAQAEHHLYPTGENWVQAMLDTLMGCVRPDISKATEDDFKILQCRKTKGETNAVPGSESDLLKIVRMESANSKNKTVKKLLRSHPELCEQPAKTFPNFLAQLIKDAVETHFDKDPLAAIAMMINTCESLHEQASNEELEIFVSEMECYWKEQYYDNHPLCVIARLFTEKHALDSHNALIRKMSIIKLCAFLHCQASAKTAKDPAITVYPRTNVSRPCLEVVFKGKTRNYSLILDSASPRSILMDTLKYLQITKSHETLKSIETAVEGFLSGITFGGKWSTPMLDELRFFDHDLDFFETAATSSLILQYPLLGMFLFFACQAQLGDMIPLQPILVNLPLTIYRIPNNKAFVFEHLANLIQDPMLIQALKMLRKYLDGNKFVTDQSVIEKWIGILSQEISLLPLAKLCFAETLHQLTSVSFENRKNVLIKLYQQSKKIDASFSIQIVQFIQEKSYASLKEQIEFFKDILCYNFSDPQDILRLEKIAENIYQALKKGKFKNETVTFKSVLPKLAERSPRVESLMKQMESPVYELPDEGVPLAAETISSHVESIEVLATQHYERAAESLYDLARIIFSIPQGKILALVEKIVSKAFEESNLALLQVILRHDMLHEYFLVEPEAFFSFIITALNRIERSNIRGKEDTKASIIEKVLKSFTKNQTPRLSSDTLHRLTLMSISVFNDRHYLVKPIPETYTRTFTQAFNTLFITLNIRGLNIDCVRLYDTMYTVDRGNPNIAKCAALACESLGRLLDETSFTEEVENISEAIIVPIINHSSETSRIATLKFLLEIFEKTQTLARKFKFLNHLATMGSLAEVDSLNYLFPLFKSLAFSEQYMEALHVIQFFNGTVSSESFPDSRHYHQFVGKLIRESQWQLACQALAWSPFTWTNPSFQSKMDDYAKTVLAKLNVEETHSLEELKRIFTVIEKYAISELDLISSFYEKCESVMDVSLARKLKSIFIKYFMKMSSDASQHFDQPIFVVLKALKFLNVSESEQLLNDKQFLEFCSRNLHPDTCFDVYKHLWKAFLHLIKNSKATERKKLIKQLEFYFEMWMNGLGIIKAAHIEEARLDLIQYYLGTNDPELMTEVIDHLATCGRTIDQAPSLADTYKRILPTVYQRIIKHSGLDDTVRLTMVIDDLIKSDMPPLAQTKCLNLCYDPHALETGMRIINNCLNLKTFTREEIPALKTYDFYNYLAYVIRHMKPTERAVCEDILNNPRLRLFMNSRELWALESLMSENYFTQAIVNGKDVPELSKKALEYVCAKFYGIAEVNHKGIFKKTVGVFFESYFTQKDDTYFMKMLNALKQSSKASECILMFAFEIRRKVYNHFWDNYDESRMVPFIKAINDLLIADLPNKKPISDDDLEDLKMWVTLQSASSQPALAALTKEFVCNLSIVLGQYPKDLFEIRMIQSIQLREPVSEYMFQRPEEIDDIIFNITERFNLLKDKNTKGTLYGDYKHLCYLVKAIPFSSEHKKTDRLDLLIKNTFLLIAILPEEKYDSALDELIPFWIEIVGNDPLILVGSLLVYIADHHELYIKCFRKKLTTLLNLALQKKLPFTTTEFFTHIIATFDILVKRMSENFEGNESIGLKRVDNDQLLVFCKEVLDIYMEFYNESALLDLSDRDKMDACEKYVHILHILIDKFPKQLVIKDPKFVAQIFSNADLLLSNVPRSNQYNKNICNKLQKRVLPALQSRFHQRCKQFKKN